MPSFCSRKHACAVCNKNSCDADRKLEETAVQLTSWHACSDLTTYVMQASLQALAQDHLVAERIQIMP